jgi:hypothetical protein
MGFCISSLFPSFPLSLLFQFFNSFHRGQQVENPFQVFGPMLCLGIQVQGLIVQVVFLHRFRIPGTSTLFMICFRGSGRLWFRREPKTAETQDIAESRRTFGIRADLPQRCLDQRFLFGKFR